MSLIPDIIIPTTKKVFPTSIPYSALLESGYSSTGAPATNATIALGWKPTKATSTPLIDMTGHYAVTIRKVDSTVTVWKGGTELAAYGGAVGSTYAELVNNVLTFYGGAEEGYYSRIAIVEDSLTWSSFWEASDLVTGLYVPIILSGLTLHTLLDFSNAADLGDDSSGNGNDWTLSGSQSVDTITNNACVLNALDPNAGTLSNGNLTLASGTAQPTIQPETGKWSYKKGSVEQLYDADTSGKFEPDLAADTYIFTGYTPTAGYNLITTENLTDPTLMKSAEYADIVLREGTGAESSISSLAFNPDIVNSKDRDNSRSWAFVDSENGATKYLKTDTTAALQTDAQSLKTFDSTGYTLGTSSVINYSGASFIDTCLKAGAEQGLYAEGGISHTNGAATTITHNMGAVVTFGIIKRTDSTGNWYVFHKDLGTGKYLILNTTAAAVTSAGFWSTNTSTTFDIPNSLATGTYVIYLFTDSDIFKAFSYTGNGNADGPFVNLGGKPLMIPFLKDADVPRNWNNFYSVTGRNPTYYLAPNDAVRETSTLDVIRFTSSGIKCSGADGRWNNNGVQMIGLAMLESTKYSNAF